MSSYFEAGFMVEWKNKELCINEIRFPVMTEDTQAGVHSSILQAGVHSSILHAETCVGKEVM